MGDRPLPDIMTPAEVAALWQIDAKTVTRWARSGLLPCFRTIGGHRRYRAVDVQAAWDKANENP